MGFSVASCDHGGQMMGRTMLDKSGTYSKLSAKSRVEFTAEHGIAATCSVACWKFAILCCPCMKYSNLQRAIKQCRCEGILTELRELERK